MVDLVKIGLKADFGLGATKAAPIWASQRRLEVSLRHRLRQQLRGGASLRARRRWEAQIGVSLCEEVVSSWLGLGEDVQFGPTSGAWSRSDLGLGLGGQLVKGRFKLGSVK